MNYLVQECYLHYKAINYKAALKFALYEFTSIREFSSESTNSASIAMHKDVVLQDIEN